jgi:2-iminoacetate synthase
MGLAKPGLIKQHCLPNGLLTLKEYLVDYASNETNKIGNKLIGAELEKITSRSRKKETENYLKQIENGKKDLYF